MIDPRKLNHGLAISSNNDTVYASSADSVFAWSYDPTTGTTSGDSTTIISGMTSDNQVTRTLLASRAQPGMLLVLRGSDESESAGSLSSGLGQIRAFDLSSLSSSSSSQPYNFDTSGTLLGWGLFNAVGISEYPKTGGLFSVDNGADDVTREGVDVHQTNPGDELNYHGVWNGTAPSPVNVNYGYLYCYATWNTTIPEAPAHLKVGAQFSAVDDATLNDTTCQQEYVSPRLTFPPHQVNHVDS